jgi:hypothetical protein
VPESPSRPFVPHRSPQSSRQVVTLSEFRLSRPFVPRESLPGIGDFLATPERRAEPVAVSVPAQALDEYTSDLDDDLDELPPVEHFMDPLPGVEAFAPDVIGALGDTTMGGTDYAPSSTTIATAEEAGWVEDTWQQYDWRAAAALGDEPESEASNEWAATDWDTGAPVARNEKPSAADAIASALDQIARRIREGELAVPSPGSLTDPTKIAATLAALLGVRP